MKIKILEIIRGLDIGGDSGGAELFGVKLSQELNRNPNCEVWICAFYRVGTKVEQDWCEKLNNEGIKTFFVSEWGGYNNFQKFYKGISTLKSLISKMDFDVCHSHFQLGTLAAVILKFLGYTKTAYRTAHVRKEWDQGKWTWLLSPLFVKCIFPKYLDGEIGVSEAVCDYLLSRRPNKINQKKIHLIYNGINADKIKQMSQEPLSWEEKQLFDQTTFNIGCIGRLAEQKGYPYIIHAMKKVIRHIPNAVLYIVGDGELKTELQDMVYNFNLSEQIKFLGLKNNVPALLRHWDLFVLPSLWEGLPTVVMEAMICEIPVIATNIPGTNELVIDEETGLLVPEKDPDSLADAIIVLFTEPLMRTKLVLNAKNFVEIFNMTNISKKYYELFQNNLNN